MRPGKEVKMKKYTMLVALILAAATAAWASQTVNESRPIASDAEVWVENLAGSLVFEGWDRSVLEVTGTLGDGVERLDIDSDEDGISIEVVFDEEYHGRQVDPTDLTIRLPRGVSLEVETVSASISVSGLLGELDLESVSGGIRVDGTPSGVDAESVSGDVIVAMAPDGADLATVSGTIQVAGVSGAIDAENVSGSIVIEGDRLYGADLETVSGNIECHAVPGTHGDVDMETMSGTITLYVDADAPAYYELNTFSGKIANDIGPEATRTSKYTPGKELSFNTGSGGPRISLESFSGAIKLLTK